MNEQATWIEDEDDGAMVPCAFCEETLVPLANRQPCDECMARLFSISR